MVTEVGSSATRSMRLRPLNFARSTAASASCITTAASISDCTRSVPTAAALTVTGVVVSVL